MNASAWSSNDEYVYLPPCCMDSMAKNQLYFAFDGRENSVMFDQEHSDELIVGGLGANRVVPRHSAALSPAAAPITLLAAGGARNRRVRTR